MSTATTLAACREEALLIGELLRRLGWRVVEAVVATEAAVAAPNAAVRPAAEPPHAGVAPLPPSAGWPDLIDKRWPRVFGDKARPDDDPFGDAARRALARLGRATTETVAGEMARGAGLALDDPAAREGLRKLKEKCASELARMAGVEKHLVLGPRGTRIAEWTLADPAGSDG